MAKKKPAAAEQGSVGTKAAELKKRTQVATTALRDAKKSIRMLKNVSKLPPPPPPPLVGAACQEDPEKLLHGAIVRLTWRSGGRERSSARR